MARYDEEAKRVLPYSIEFGRSNLDRDGAAGLRTLAHKLQGLVDTSDAKAFLEVRDVRIHLAEEPLIPDCPLVAR
jgi:hypothetical protein